MQEGEKLGYVPERRHVGVKGHGNNVILMESARETDRRVCKRVPLSLERSSGILTPQLHSFLSPNEEQIILHLSMFIVCIKRTDSDWSWRNVVIFSGWLKFRFDIPSLQKNLEFLYKTKCFTIKNWNKLDQLSFMEEKWLNFLRKLFFLLLNIKKNPSQDALALLFIFISIINNIIYSIFENYCRMHWLLLNIYYY